MNTQTPEGSAVVPDSFLSFGFSEAVNQAVARIGFTEPTEIQAKSFPVLLNGKDIVGQSKTGSGKTAAYILPSLNVIMNSPGVTLVLVPTRELAIQVEDFVKQLVPRFSKVRMVSIIGGGSMNYQVKMLNQKPNLILATPGRLVDHLTRGTLNLSDLKILVLDEADRMLDMGFYPQIKRILGRVPQDRQTILFSATFSDEVRKLTRELTRQAVEVSAGTKNEAPTTIQQEVLEMTTDKKNDTLLDQLNAREGSVLIFVKTKHKTERVVKYLSEYGFKVNRIHGDRTLAQRRLAIDNFKAGHVRILVATDIAARGLDIAQVGHVINFDLPQNAEDYLHRIGRTGRAGASGHAVSFVTPEDRRQWQMILRQSQNTRTTGGAMLNLTLTGVSATNRREYGKPSARAANYRSQAPASHGNQNHRSEAQKDDHATPRTARRDDDRVEQGFEKPHGSDRRHKPQAQASGVTRRTPRGAAKRYSTGEDSPYRRDNSSDRRFAAGRAKSSATSSPKRTPGRPSASTGLSRGGFGSKGPTGQRPRPKFAAEATDDQ